MEQLKANEIKIGILSDIKRKIEKERLSFSISYDLRGFLFTEQEKNYGRDILYPINEYPILDDNKSIYVPTISIAKYENLGPLLEYYGLTEFSYYELHDFTNMLLNKKWFKESHKLFVITKKNYGPLTVTTKVRCDLLPEELWKMINLVHDAKGFCLSKKEQKLYKTR